MTQELDDLLDLIPKPTGDPDTLGYQIERTTTIVRMLMQGRKLTTREYMRVTGLSRQGVWHQLSCIGRAGLPVTQVDGKWQLMTERDLDLFFQEHYPSSEA